jgi:adenine/guanine phosphoribosyltransferase-like PRPP-binding protein
LIQQLGATVEAALFFIELVDLEGRKRLAGVPVKTLVQF